MSTPALRILRAFVSLPTAPFVERAPLEYIRDFVAWRPTLRLRQDPFGNLLVTLPAERRRGQSSARRGNPSGANRPIVFAGHLDHPGFIARRMVARGRLVADWLGWVERRYFLGARVRFFSAGREIGGRIVAVRGDGLSARSGARPRRHRAGASARSFGAESPPREVTIAVAEPVEAGSPGMWDFPDTRRTGPWLFARACDDVAGVAAILAALDVLSGGAGTGRRGGPRPSRDVLALFTRAEEVGFGGALAAVERRELPRRAVVVAVECSKAVTGVALGAGPVLRVGDRASVFTPAATAYCQVVAERLAETDPTFAFQRKLMDGGTCESTVYCHYGYEATGICLPLGHYHNMDAESGRIAPEFIDVRDYLNLVKWFIALASSDEPYRGEHPGLAERLTTLLRQHRPVLLATRPGVELQLPSAAKDRPSRAVRARRRRPRRRPPDRGYRR